MILKPDMETATAAPWTGDWTLQVIHDAYDQAGAPVPFCTAQCSETCVRGLCQARARDLSSHPRWNSSLWRGTSIPLQPIEPMMGRSGRPAAARQAYSMSAVDEFGPVIDDIYDFAEAQGFEIDGITQEGGAGQLEINLRHGDPVKLADEVFYLQAADPRGSSCATIAMPRSWPSRSRTNRAARCTSTTRCSTRTGRTSFQMQMGPRQTHSCTLLRACKTTCRRRSL